MNGTTKKYGLIGHPLGHSFSRDYFEKKFRRENIDAVYLNFDICDDDSDFPTLLKATIRKHPELIGFNVTIPYKEKILECLDAIDSDAKRIGAVNVVKISKDKSSTGFTLTGFNTDTTGFTESLRPFIGSGLKNALVLGSGGAAKAVGHGLTTMGIRPTFVSRRPTDHQIGYSQLTPELIRSFNIIVNATPLGMYPDIETSPEIPYEALSPAHICFDLVYNPAKTRFLQLAENKGATIINGLKMLHIQAEEAWKIWNT